MVEFSLKTSVWSRSYYEAVATYPSEKRTTNGHISIFGEFKEMEGYSQERFAMIDLQGH